MRVKVQFVVQVNPTTSDWTKWVVKAWILSSEQTLVWLLRAGAGRLNTIKVQLVSHVGVFTISACNHNQSAGIYHPLCMIMSSFWN